METAHDLYDRASDAAAYIKNRVRATPEIAVIVGSGLGAIESIVAQPVRIKYADIPNFPLPAVSGHAGELIFGKGPVGQDVLVLSGRIHLYEGYTVKSVTFPIRALQLLGVKTLIITNAAGGLNQSYHCGEMMVVTDQINMTGEDPLVGEHDPRLGERYLDMTRPFDPELMAMAEEAAPELGIRLHLGVYVGVRGPTFETAAEIELLRRVGADVVGMSTVNEVIAARHAGMRVLAISVITNVAGVRLEHVADEVLAASSDAGAAVRDLTAAIIARLATQ